MQALVTVDWLYDNKDDSNIIILDASPKNNASNLIVKHPGTQIKGAIYFDVKNIFSDQLSDFPNMMLSEDKFQIACQKLGINNESKIIVYDNLGIYLSPRVWWMFKSLGHKNIAVLNGGLNTWYQKGYSCQDIQKINLLKGNFTSNPQNHFFVNKCFVKKNLYSDNILIIDARSADRFYGVIPETRKHLKSGHIPSSINLPFKNVINGVDGKMKSQEVLKKIFDNLEVGNKKLIFTCGSGITACVILFAHMVSGDNELSLYDGSWSEWGLTTTS